MKPGKKQEFFTTLKEEILPVLNEYEVEELIPPQPKAEAAKVFVISFWQSRELWRPTKRKPTPKVWAILERFVVAPAFVNICNLDQ
jgi:hypothetical protein